MRIITKKIFPFFLLCLVVFAFNGSGPLTAQSASGADLPVGKVVDRVQCLHNAEQSYALYLPSNYAKNKNWPVLFLFEPAARGKLPVELFREAAETYGYILVCSNNAKNGPFRPIFDGATSMWKDARKRFSIDERRVYAGGFSGGSRMASQFKFMVNHPVAGLIGIGAGIGVRMKPGMLKAADYFAVVGLEDFNYREVNKLMADFKTVGLTYRLRVYDARHRWPPKEICTEAIEWMEARAMKKGAKQMNAQVLDKIFKKTLALADKQEKQGDLPYAAATLQSIVQTFDGLKSTADIKKRLEAMVASKPYKKFLKAEEKRKKKELEFIRIFTNVTATVLHSTGRLRVNKMFSDMKLVYLRKEADKPDEKANKYDRALARRLLAELRVQAIQEADKQLKEKKYEKAGLLYEITLKSGNEHPNLLYNMACAYAKADKKKKALKYLEKAVEKGFKDLAHIKKDKDLDSLRGEKKYKKIIDSLAK